jgi:hypothetical protein
MTAEEERVRVYDAPIAIEFDTSSQLVVGDETAPGRFGTKAERETRMGDAATRAHPGRRHLALEYPRQPRGVEHDVALASLLQSL